jgi:hypothetical protein
VLHPLRDVRQVDPHEGRDGLGSVEFRNYCMQYGHRRRRSFSIDRIASAASLLTAHHCRTIRWSFAASFFNRSSASASPISPKAKAHQNRTSFEESARPGKACAAAERLNGLRPPRRIAISGRTSAGSGSNQTPFAASKALVFDLPLSSASKTRLFSAVTEEAAPTGVTSSNSLFPHVFGKPQKRNDSVLGVTACALRECACKRVRLSRRDGSMAA